MATRVSNSSFQVSCRVRDTSGAGGKSCVIVDAAQRALAVFASGAPVESPRDTSPETAAAATPPTSASPSTVTACSPIAAYSCFDCVFPGEASQRAVFERVGAPLIADLLAGYNCTVLAYGQTGSGKTHTTVGGPHGEARGLVPRTIEQILSEMARIDRTEFDVSLTASFVEVYQESLRDLLLPHAARALRIREDKDSGVFVDGASEILVASVASGMAVLARGAAQRATGVTLLNADSSRSHAVFTLTFTKRRVATRETLRGKLLLVDLAGSEKASKTAASGKRLDEAKYINRSLSALGNVINALTDGAGARAKFVPYRDSKLTRLLQSSLGGNAKTHLLLTCSSSELHVDETLSTLRFGARAKRIRNAPRVNNERPTSASEYKELLATLHAKLESLCAYIRRLESTRCATCASSQPQQQPQPHESSPLLARCCSCTSVPIAKLCESAACSNNSTDGDTEKDDAGVTPDSDSVCDEQSDASGTAATSLQSDSSTAHTPHSHSADRERLEDDLMQAELTSLRRAVVAMQSGRHEAEHARLVANAMAQVSRAEHDALCRSQLEQIRRQETELADADATVATLERKLTQLQTAHFELEADCRALRLETKQLKQQQTQWGEAESAEAEILRRRTATLEKQVKASQLELLVSQKRQSELAVSLDTKELELQRLGDENASLRESLASVQQSMALSASLPCLPVATASQRPSLPLPLTYAALGSSEGAGGSNGGTIQSWWAGSPERSTLSSGSGGELDQRLELAAPWLQPSGPSRHRSHQSNERRRANSTTRIAGLESLTAGQLPPDLSAAAFTTATMSPAAAATVVTAAEERRCWSQGQSRPFRARLVGLLNSLEEETSALKDLVSDTKREAAAAASHHRPTAAHTGGGRQRGLLPCLDIQQTPLG